MKLTDAGLETVLVFEEGIELPEFAAFPLVDSEDGRAALRRYYTPFLELAQDRRVPIVLSAPTWRANRDWGRLLGYEGDDLAAVNRRAIAFLEEVRDEALEAADRDAVVIEACIGPRSDAYRPTLLMDEEEAERYHAPQLGALAETGCAQVSALTLAYPEEAIGIVRAATAAGLPVVVGFTVETDGRLPNGASIEDAILAVDAATEGAVQGFMINCAHPTHFARALDERAAWTRRIGGVRANASCRSHAELNDAADLDRGNPGELAAEYGALLERLPHLRVFGGCCGTDHQHVRAIAAMLARRGNGGDGGNGFTRRNGETENLRCADSSHGWTSHHA